jgi:hypothetical protein
MTALALLGVFAAAQPARAQKGARIAPARQALLETINRRFMNQVIKEMALTPEQVPRFQRVVLSWAQKRSALEEEERRLHQALTGDELRPGVAANPDSVSREVDGINAVRVKYAEAMRDEMLELAPILSPVQRGQFKIRRDQFLQRVRDLQQQRPGGAPTDPGGP